MLMSQLALPIDLRDSLCLHLVEFLLIAAYGIHFGPDSNELTNGSHLAIFVLPFSEPLLVRRTVQDVRFRILAAIKMIRRVRLHLFVYVAGFDGIHQTVGIGKQKLCTFGRKFPVYVIVMQFVHDGLCNVQNDHSGKYRFVHHLSLIHI